jgi:hypothetical protein
LRRYTPGVLVIYRRSSRLGASTTIDLTEVTVVASEKGHPRQFLVVTGKVLYRIRSLKAANRAPWVDCIRNSAVTFERATAIVRSRSLQHGAGAVQLLIIQFTRSA